MMSLLIMLVAQDATIYETKHKYESALKAIDGVIDVSVGGINSNLKIVVRVRDEKAKNAVSLLTANGLNGFQVHVMVSATSNPVTIKNDAPKKEEKPVVKAAPKKEEVVIPDDRNTNIWKASVTDCDIIRDYMKMKPLTHKIGRGCIAENCKMVLRQVVGAGGGHSYVYTKHRGECPVRLGRVKQPDWADGYIAWVFQKGFGPAMRGSFLWPFELRASDKLWIKQVREDLMTRLQYIREGAEWVQTPDERPGVGWTWSAPSSGSGSADSIPTGGKK